MGAPVELSKDMIVTVTSADGTALASGDTYVAGEVLKIGLPVDIPGVFEAMGGDFVKGACGARRILPDANGFAGRWGREGRREGEEQGTISVPRGGWSISWHRLGVWGRP